MREDASGHFQTWTACPDLTHARQITSDPIRSSGWPVWSPDGRRIAFNANHEDPDVEDAAEVWDIYTMDADGGTRIKLTDAIGLLGDPGYSPDGRLIAFDSDEPGREGIYTMNAADGSDVRLVTALPSDATFDYQPQFSPDGTSILFVRESGPRAASLYLVDIDGSDLHRITDSSVRPGHFSWSPDGTQIVFEADLVRGRGDAWIIGSDGSDLRNLTWREPDQGRWDGFSDPVWSPDGSQILLVHGLHYEDGSSTGGLATIRPDGTDLRYVGDGLGEEHKADWNAASCRGPAS